MAYSLVSHYYRSREWGRWRRRLNLGKKGERKKEKEIKYET